jgi:hypothetical protein
VQEGHNRGTQQKEEDQERAPNKERAPHGFVVYVDCLRAQALPTAVCAIILKNKPPRPYRSHVEAAPDIRGRPANSNNATPCEPPTRSPVARHTAANARARRRIALAQCDREHKFCSSLPRDLFAQPCALRVPSMHGYRVTPTHPKKNCISNKQNKTTKALKYLSVP